MISEIIFRILSGAFKANKSLNNSPNVEGSNAEHGKENEKIDFEINPKKKRFFHRRCGRGLAGLAEGFKSMCGRKEEKYNDNVYQDDQLVKDGLRREDKFVKGGNVKISSYYDKDDRMVFQRETILPPLTVNDIKNSSQGTNNPSFFIKPQEATSTDNVNNVEEQMDKSFEKERYVGKELADSEKTFVDEHINKTFKDIYDMVLPSIF